MNNSSQYDLINTQARNQNLTKISKFLSLILRHQPETIGLTLDEQGWANVDTLIELARQNGRSINRLTLEQVVASNDKKRFTFNEDKSKIKANQGHSVAVDLALTPQQPPEYLYHGTATKFMESILHQGLVKQNRNHVHLSTDKATAIKVGTRHGIPIVFKIQAQKMSEEGFCFFLSKNNVWLTDRVPASYIIVECEGSGQ
jgi:putative RNA 2'-phosphotransferase